jgi:thiosulfate/3-mercaptopyruvate sulfurtransferase
MKITHKLTLSILLVFLAFAGSIAQGDYVSADVFKGLIKDSEVVIIDASKSKNYAKSHVKNAISIQHGDLYLDVANNPEGLLKDPADLANYFGSLGIDENTSVIIYDEGTQKYSSRVYFVMKYIGSKNVQLTHQHPATWQKNRIPLTSSVPKPGETVVFTPEIQQNMIADLDFVKNNLGNEEFVFIDTRDEKEFIGEKKVVDGVFGRLPNTVNIPYKEFQVEGGALKSKAELELFAEKYGIDPEKQIIVFCRTGVKGSVAYIALNNILEHKNVKLFDGGCAEYSSKYELVK